MGIEDVQFLKTNAVKEEYVAVIDSAKRDKLQYPTPQEYVVYFDAPFENVYGIDIINVNIPRSGYIIDTFNNLIVFRFEYAGSPPNNWITTRRIPPGNYGITSAVSQEITDISDLVEALEETLVDTTDSRALDDPNKRRIRVEIVGAENQTDPALIEKAFRRNKKIRLKSPYVFAIDVKRSTLRTIIGLSSESDLSDKVSSNDIGGQLVSAAVFQGPFGATELFPVTRDKYLIQTFAPVVIGGIVRSGPLRQIDIKFGRIGIPPSDSLGYVTIRIEEERLNENNEIELVVVYVKNIPYSTLLQSELVSLTEEDVLYLGSVVTIKKDVRYSFYLIDNDNTDINNCWAVYHGELSNQPTGNTLYKVELGERIQYYDPSHLMHLVVYSFTSGQVMDPSGIVDLFGERYIQLRCPEVEEHMHRNRAFERYNVGMAIIPTSLEYRNLTEKFVMLPSRTFHPIGRLKRMTFRFETASGVLYNFNGIDHTVTMVLRYYKVSEPPPMDAFVQNPHYRPNYLEYLHEHTLRDRSDSEDEEDDKAPEYHPWQ